MNERNQFSRGPPLRVPVNVGDELNVTIEAVGEKGDGIAKHKGFVLFVPGTKEGDYVKIRVTKVIRKVGFAEVAGPADAPKTQKPSEQEAAQAAQEFVSGGEDQPQYEDTEDFGEEPAEEPSEEPAEELPEETPDEEPAEEELSEEYTEELPEEESEEKQE